MIGTGDWFFFVFSFDVQRWTFDVQSSIVSQLTVRCRLLHPIIDFEIWNAAKISKKPDQKYNGNAVLAITSCLLTLFCLSITGCTINPFSQRDMLVGETTEAACFDRFPDWEKRKNQYEPGEQSIEGLHTIQRKISLLLFLGTWSSDSRKEVPTVILVEDGEELGRIVEYPERTWEKDLLETLES